MIKSYAIILTIFCGLLIYSIAFAGPDCSDPTDRSTKTETIILTKTLNDFRFTYYQSNADDDVWCGSEKHVCSTQGDYCGGKKELHIEKLSIGEKIIIKSSDSGFLALDKLAENYPYIVIRNHSGGGSCCVGWIFISKEKFWAKPFVIEYSQRDILSITDVGPKGSNTILKGFNNGKPLEWKMSIHFQQQLEKNLPPNSVIYNKESLSIKLILQHL